MSGDTRVMELWRTILIVVLIVGVVACMVALVMIAPHEEPRPTKPPKQTAPKTQEIQAQPPPVPRHRRRH